MPKRASQVILTAKQRDALVQLTRRHRSEQQQVQRARILLAAAEGHCNIHIAQELSLHVDTVRLWRDRWVALRGIDFETLSLTERLRDAPDRAPQRRSPQSSAVRSPPWPVKRR